MRFSNSLAIAQSGTNIILENISSEVFLVDHSSCQDYLLDALAQCSDSVFVRILVPGRVRRVSFLLVWREVDPPCPPLVFTVQAAMSLRYFAIATIGLSPVPGVYSLQLAWYKAHNGGDGKMM